MHQNLKDTTTTIRNMDIEPLNANPSPHGHQARQEDIKTLTIGITIQDIAITTTRNMDISLRIALEHISVVTTRDG